MINYNRIQELCSHLDAVIYGKGCNYIQEDELTFYSRDYCRKISFKELLRWYIERIHHTEENENINIININIDYLMELIDIYSVYYVISKINN